MANSPAPDYSPRKQPAHEVRLGAVKAAIWQNDTDSGVRYNVTFQRLYRDGDAGQWKSTESFGRDDLLLVAKVADLAHTWIMTPEQAEERAAPESKGSASNELSEGSM